MLARTVSSKIENQFEEAKMSTVTSADGTTIGYTRTGSGPPVVLVDAASCFRGNGPMDALAEALAPDFTVFTYDRRGRGESTDTPPYTIGREVDDLRAVIDAAGGAAGVHGFSSGAVLALHAAAAGAPITRLSLLEPPLADDPVPEVELVAELEQLVREGRRGDAVLRFNQAIGVPEEFVAGLRRSPAWAALEELAHTLVYDLAITGAAPDLTAVRVPALVVDSERSDPRLREWSDGVARRLPDATRVTLPGEWHGVGPDVLTPVLAAHFGQPAA
ncbi:alpha/beta fold hydrolase [Saccharothrix sp. NPDC042600]|uniref:alpha/beta fold hydrolase n=1 Tax=Saccharothrix TaxID=2071 RepID=UPI0033F69395|nr:alpha/beta hydrolase [Saccharothrix mutabilis subsp. capreolus]